MQLFHLVYETRSSTCGTPDFLSLIVFQVVKTPIRIISASAPIMIDQPKSAIFVFCTRLCIDCRGETFGKPQKFVDF